MLQVILKFNQNLISFLLQNWSKFDQKSIKKLHRIQSWFWNRYFFDFWSIFNKFWTNFGSKMARVLPGKSDLEAFPTPKSTPKAVWHDFWTNFGRFLSPKHQKCWFGFNKMHFDVRFECKKVGKLFFVFQHPYLFIYKMDL